MPKAGNNYSEQVVKNANFMYFICSVSSKRMMMEFAKLISLKAVLKSSILIILQVSDGTYNK